MRERPQCTLVAELPEVRRKQSTVDEAPAWYTFFLFGNAATFRNAGPGRRIHVNVG